MRQIHNIPLVDLKLQYLELKNEIDSAIMDCVSESNFIKGKPVAEFEKLFSEYLGTKYCIGCGNGTDALEIILKSLKIGIGDEVIVPAMTWIATAEAVSNVGAEPVFVDINPLNYTIDVRKIEEKITQKTKAIIPVHLYGCPADMDEVIRISREHRIYIVEDCAQAHGAQYNGKMVGTFGVASAFSFFPSKNLGAFGDGGAIVTSDKELANIARMISNHGQLIQRHSHLLIGRNSRLDTIQAAVLKAKLPHLDKMNKDRIEAANYYNLRLKENNSIILPGIEDHKKSVFHLFVVRIKNRNVLMKMLNENKISSGIHYPVPLPFLEAYRYKKHKLTEFPVAFITSNDILSIPIYPGIRLEQIDIICNLLLKHS